jgi:mono/diheme cytochrome c family protein
MLGLSAVSLAWLAPSPPQVSSAGWTSADGPLPGNRRRAVELFKQRCSSCHAADGTGSVLRKRVPQVPDFTSPRWHRRHSEAQLVRSILDGQGGRMPAFRSKLSPDQAENLAALIRTFDPTYDPNSGTPAIDPEEFRKRLRQLDQELEALKKKFREPPAPHRP